MFLYIGLRQSGVSYCLELIGLLYWVWVIY